MNTDLYDVLIRGDIMPVNLPAKQPIDPRLLGLLARVAQSSGRLLVSDEEFSALEEEQFFKDGERRGLFTVEQDGEWVVGAVIAITRSGRLLIGEPLRESLWKKLELILRSRIGS